jgi:hypothetical protein
MRKATSNMLPYVGGALQGQALFLVGASLRFSGDLLLQGIPDHPGAPGSWVMLPLLQLTNTGSLQLQVSVCAHTCSPMALHTHAPQRNRRCASSDAPADVVPLERFTA